MPTAALQLEGDSLTAVDLLVNCSLAASRGEARRLIQQGGVTFNGEKVSDPFLAVSADDLKKGVKIRKGKKVYHKAVLKA